MMKNKISSIIMMLLLVASVLVGCEEIVPPTPDGDDNTPIDTKPTENTKIKRFSSDKELEKTFEERETSGRYIGEMDMESSATIAGAMPKATRDFSETNIQVEGVDEADIVKTDGDYVYTISEGKLYIIKAYPPYRIGVASGIKFDNFNPREMFIHDNRLLVFGSSSYRFDQNIGEPVDSIAPYPRYMSTMTAKLYDIADKEEPELLRTVDFEGSYLTSRKIGEYAYFIVNSYPNYAKPVCGDIIPLYKENDEMPEPIVKCTEVGYIEPLQPENFIIIASISMTDEDEEVGKEVILGSGQNVYASLENLYIAQTSWPRYNRGELAEDFVEQTIITRFELDNGDVEFKAIGKAKGHILNQFSMDEYDNHFRIATTSGNFWQGESANNVYVLDKDMDIVGELEDLAPGEKIYSVRFMGKKGYVVTFKKVDPLFVIDLSDHEDPDVLGKLKIPGYSDYLHPFDENHIIGIGKDTVEAAEDLKDRRNLDFAWYQGIKMAIFDVSDVENPIEMHKVIIGDRGTNSEALHNHKAFLFDREKELLVIPITLAEFGDREPEEAWETGDYTFQGAYVYNIDLKHGFDLAGRVTHYENDEAFKKSGYYFRGDRAIRRSLYIEDVLYTLSDKRLQLNDLDEIKITINAVEFDEADYPTIKG